MNQNKYFNLSDLSSINLDLKPWNIVFLYWDLWSWKTTLISNIIKNQFKITDTITSPTYIHYKKYNNIYHFDLYRLESYDDFVNIGWEEILDNQTNVSFIEWPELLKWYYEADIEIFLSKWISDDLRKIEILYRKR